MAIATSSQAAPSYGEDEPVRPFVWNRARLRQLIDAGVILEGDRVELIEGELVVMPVQKEPHAVAGELTEEALRQAFGSGYHIRGQRPVALGDLSEPEPDVAVVRGGIRDYLVDHPGPEAIVLLVEISDTTLRHDRVRQMSMYAKYGVPEVWLVNLVERVLEVHREPAPDPTAPYGFSYRSRQSIPADGQVAPLVLPDHLIKVADLLP